MPIRALPPVLLLLAFGGPAGAVESYRACIDMIEADPKAAAAEASAWAAEGGGAAARHCHALAVLATGAKGPAAALLADLGRTALTLPDLVRADIMVEAGVLFLELGDLGAARAARDAALRLGGRRTVTLELSARLAAERRDWRTAERDLTAALNLRDPDPALLVLRASARRRLGKLIEARDDATAAVQKAPGLAIGWMELGDIRRALGDLPGARAAFSQAALLAEDTPLGENIRRRIQRLETGE